MHSVSLANVILKGMQSMHFFADEVEISMPSEAGSIAIYIRMIQGLGN